MSEFKIGDKIRLKADHNIKREVIGIYGDKLKLKYFRRDGTVDDFLTANESLKVASQYELDITQIPLYSEEQAVSFLREKGYKVEAPPKPLKGKVYIYNFPQLMGGKNSVHALTANEFARNDWVAKPNVIAIVDWTEGQGI